MWSGWSTYPQIFINGFLLGGYSELKKSLKEDIFIKLLNLKKDYVPLEKKIEEIKVTDVELDAQYLKKCLELNEITLEELNVPKKYRLDESEFKQPYSEIISLLRELNAVHTPEEQLKVLEKCIQGISTCIEYFYKKNQNSSEVMIGADDMIPILIYCIIKAKVKNLYSTMKTLSEYADLRGSGGYAIASLDTCIRYISSLKLKRSTVWNWGNVKLNDF